MNQVPSSLEVLRRSAQFQASDAVKRRMWCGIATRLARPAPAPVGRRLALLSVAVAIGALSLLGVWFEAQPQPLRLADGSAFVELKAGSAAATAEFSDGSRVTAQPQSRVTSLAQTASEVILMLHSGRAQFAVTQGGPRTWSIEAGAVQVQVVGTVFVVERTQREVLVQVKRGAVLVRSQSLPDSVRRLGPGQHVLVRTRPAVDGPADTVPAKPAEAVVPAQPAEAVVPAELAVASTPPAASLAAVEPSATAAPSAKDSAHVTRLLARADTARLEGNSRQTQQLLEQVANDYPGDSRAALSAFQVGVMRLNRGDYQGAQRWLTTALKRDPPVSLLEDCYWRLLQAQGSLGERARARRTAGAYLARFPRGRHQQAVQAELAAVNQLEREE